MEISNIMVNYLTGAKEEGGGTVVESPFNTLLKTQSNRLGEINNRSLMKRLTKIAFLS